MRVRLLLAVAWVALAAPAAWSQKGIEITPFIGGQINGGLDISTPVFNSIDMQNGMSYGVSGVYLLREYTGVEFMWNHNTANTLAQMTDGGPGPRVLEVHTNQFLGDFIVHFKSRESRFRPYVLVGAGISNLAAGGNYSGSITRFAWAFGGGVKYNLSQHLGVRLQMKTSPTYINSGAKQFWCEPSTGGCWSIGENNFLQELDFSGGITFRF
jgi:opacity protein-like surface antigen